MNLLVEIDGQTVPLNRCFWVRFTPDGCAEGSSHGETAMDAEAAHQWFTPRLRDRDRENRKGYRHELVTAFRWDAEVKPCLLGKCTHRKAAASA